MKKIRIWLDDKVEKSGGLWCYGIVNDKGFFIENNSKDDKPDLIQQYVEWGYKVEYLDPLTLF